MPSLRHILVATAVGAAALVVITSMPLPWAGITGASAVPATNLLEAAARSINDGAGPGHAGRLSCEAAGAGSSVTCATSLPANPPSAIGPRTEVNPSTRWGAGMVYDAHDGYVVLFSGSGNAGPLYGETWTFRAGVWTDRTPATCVTSIPNATDNESCPLDRTYPAMAYDAADGYIVMFGGQFRSHKTLLDDTWTYSAGAWKNVTTSVRSASGPANYPRGTHYPSAAYDTKDGYVVMFGGCTEWQCNAGEFNNYTYSYLAGRWTNETPALPTPLSNPPPLYAASMAYFGGATNGYIVLFGGNLLDLILVNYTWTYSAGAWENVSVTDPTPSDYPPTAYYAGLAGNGSTVVLFGGTLNIVKADNDVGNVTWAFTGISHGLAKWENITRGTAPPRRLGGSLAYDSADHYFVLFGGLSGTLVGLPTLDDTWTLSGGRWSPVDFAVQFTESGLPSGARWNVTMVGHTLSAPTGGPIEFIAPNGTFEYALGMFRGYAPTTPAEASVTVDGTAVTVTFHFVRASSVTFHESGLPSHANWSVRVNGASVSSDRNTIVESLVNGSYSYTCGSVPGYITPPGGSFSVKGRPLTFDLSYSVAKYTITFAETGLPPKTPWNVTIGRGTVSATGTTIKFRLANGSYAYTIGRVPGYTTDQSGTVSVDGNNMTVPVQFSPSDEPASPTVMVLRTSAPLAQLSCPSPGLG